MNVNVHFHLLAIDGVYAEGDNGRISFHHVSPPSDKELTRIAERIARRIENGILVYEAGSHREACDGPVCAVRDHAVHDFDVRLVSYSLSDPGYLQSRFAQSSVSYFRRFLLK